jgi:hypothetical protein
MAVNGRVVPKYRRDGPVRGLVEKAFRVSQDLLVLKIGRCNSSCSSSHPRLYHLHSPISWNNVCHRNCPSYLHWLHQGGRHQGEHQGCRSQEAQRSRPLLEIRLCRCCLLLRHPRWSHSRRCVRIFTSAAFARLLRAPIGYLQRPMADQSPPTASRPESSLIPLPTTVVSLAVSVRSSRMRVLALS